MRIVNGTLVADDDGPSPVADDFDVESVSDDNTPKCEDCGEPIEWAGRGRRPKYHPEHRPTAPKRGGAPGGTRATLRNEAALRDALASRYQQMSMFAAMIHPAYAEGIRQKMNAAIEADIEYARVSPTFRRQLENILEKTALGAVIAVHAAMFAPVVVGERAKAMRRGAAAQQAKQQQQPRPTTARQAYAPPPPPPPSNNVHDLYPREPDDVGAETVNAAAMPGMPG